MKEIVEITGVDPASIAIKNVKLAVHRGTDSSLFMVSATMRFNFAQSRESSEISEAQKSYLCQLYNSLAQDEKLGKLTLSQFRGKILNGKLPDSYEKADVDLFKKMLVPNSPR